MMFKTNAGPIESDESITYLRPETAQGMFVNFKNILDSIHPSLPFGMAQIGKAFRNEIAPRDFIFRSREFEQMEIEYFVKPTEWKQTFESFVSEIHEFTNDIGLNKNHVHELEIPDGDRAHYSKRTIDFEFDFPFGKKELYGLAYRTDFDLKAHSESSKVDLSYYDEESKERYIPHCIEPSFGVERTVLAVLSDAYTEDEIDGEKRVYMKFSPKIAPVKVAVFPIHNTVGLEVAVTVGVGFTVKETVVVFAHIPFEPVKVYIVVAVGVTTVVVPVKAPGFHV